MKNERRSRVLVIAEGINALPSRRAEKARLYNPLNSGLDAPKPKAEQSNKK